MNWPGLIALSIVLAGVLGTMLFVKAVDDD